MTDSSMPLSSTEADLERNVADVISNQLDYLRLVYPNSQGTRTDNEKNLELADVVKNRKESYSLISDISRILIKGILCSTKDEASYREKALEQGGLTSLLLNIDHSALLKGLAVDVNSIRMQNDRMLGLTDTIQRNLLSRSHDFDVPGSAESGEAYNQKVTKAQPVQSDAFAFEAILIFIAKGSSQATRIPCRGQMDTGSRENWISRRVIASTYLEYTIKDLEYPRAYRAFGGDMFFPIGQVEVQWYLEDESRSRKSTFLVGDEVPFDMVVGSVLIQQEELLARKQAALGVRVVDPTPEELVKMEWEALVGSRNRQQLAAIRAARKVKAAEDRERERQRVAAQSAAQTTTTNSSVTTTGSAPASSSGLGPVWSP